MFAMLKQQQAANQPVTSPTSYSHHSHDSALPRAFETTSSFYIDHERNTVHDPVNQPIPNQLKAEKGPAATTSWRQECFSSWPQIATDDTLGDAGLRKLNKDSTWPEYCRGVIKNYKQEKKHSVDSDDEDDYHE